LWTPQLLDATMTDPRTNLYSSALALADALDAIAPVLGQTTHRSGQNTYVTRGIVSVFCKPGGKTRWSRRKGTEQTGHQEMAFQTRVADLCRAAAEVQEALFAWPAFRHPTFTFKIRNFYKGDPRNMVYFSLSDKPMGNVSTRELAGLFDAIAAHTEGLSTQPSDPTWVVGGTSLGAPSAAQALVVRQILADPKTGFVAKKSLPKVSLLQDSTEVLRAARALAGVGA
jgi:hypothetical protein